MAIKLGEGAKASLTISPSPHTLSHSLSLSLYLSLPLFIYLFIYSLCVLSLSFFWRQVVREREVLIILWRSQRSLWLATDSFNNLIPRKSTLLYFQLISICHSFLSLSFSPFIMGKLPHS